MIIKASQRAGANQLAQHLMNARDNEHVELHELRGFAADDLPSTLQEARVIRRLRQCAKNRPALTIASRIGGMRRYRLEDLLH